MRGYRRENPLDDAWLQELPYFLKLREIDLYAIIHRSFDVNHLDEPWVARFMAGRKQLHLSSAAVLDGNNPGRVCVDDPAQPQSASRRHYVCCQVRYDWRANIPAGFAVHRLDESLLNRPSLSIPGHIKGWMENNTMYCVSLNREE